MAKSTDLRSFLLGSLVTLLVLFVLGATTRVSPSNPTGRFALVPSAGNEAWVCDTVTGQVWSRYDNARDGGAQFYGSKLKENASGEPNKAQTR